MAIKLSRLSERSIIGTSIKEKFDYESEFFDNSNIDNKISIIKTIDYIEHRLKMLKNSTIKLEI